MNQQLTLQKGKSNKTIFDSFLSLDRKRKWLYFLYAFLLISIFPEYIKSFENAIGWHFFNDYSNAFFIAIAVIGSYKLFLESVRVFDVIFLFVIVFWHQYSPLIFPETSIYSIENTDRFLFTCLPLYLVGITFDSKQSKEVFVLMSWLALLLQTINLSVRGMGYDESGEVQDELMGAAYGLLPFVLILLWNAFEEGGIINAIISIIAVFIELSLGTRGPVICVAFFIAIYFIAFRTYKHNVFIKSLIAGIAGLVYLFATEIVLIFSPVAMFLGLSTRVFDSYLEGTLVNYNESSFRDDIYAVTLKSFNERHSFWGEGLYSDRFLSKTGQYCHNFEIEILCAFGYLFGIILLFSFLLRKRPAATVLFFVS